MVTYQVLGRKQPWKQLLGPESRNAPPCVTPAWAAAKETTQVVVYQISTRLCKLDRVYKTLRVVSNFGDRNCGAGEIHTHARARNFEETWREGSAKN